MPIATEIAKPASGFLKLMSEPFPDVIQDLWQLSNVTTSYVEGFCRIDPDVAGVVSR